MLFIGKIIARLRRPKRPPPPLDTLEAICLSGKADPLACGHGTTDHALRVVVLGVTCELKSSPMCQRCTERYLDRHSTLCVICKQPIYPGKPIGYGQEGESGHAFAHASCTDAAVFCGHWGEGRPVYLEESRPDKYGTRSRDTA